MQANRQDQDHYVSVLHCAHREKAVFFGEDDTAGESRRQQGKRKRTMRWSDSLQEAIGMRLQELSRALEDRALWTSLIHSVIWIEPTQWQETTNCITT